MPDVLQIPADLTPLLRYSALDLYNWAAETAAGRAVTALRDDRTREDMERFWEARDALLEAQRALELIGDDLTADGDWEIALEGDARAHLGRLIDNAIREKGYVTDMWDSHPDEIVAKGRTIERLRALRAQAGVGMVTA
jgi:hypothetical protein